MINLAVVCEGAAPSLTQSWFVFSQQRKRRREEEAELCRLASSG